MLKTPCLRCSRTSSPGANSRTFIFTDTPTLHIHSQVLVPSYSHYFPTYSNGLPAWSNSRLYWSYTLKMNYCHQNYNNTAGEKCIYCYLLQLPLPPPPPLSYYLYYIYYSIVHEVLTNRKNTYIKVLDDAVAS